MATLPILLELIDELGRGPSDWPYGSDFGLGLDPRHIHYHGHQQPRRIADRHPAYALPLSLLLAGDRQLARRSEPKETAGPVAKIGKHGFQVSMDVTQFKPNELNVKVVDNSIVVEGKHEEREDDHGYISRHFVRRYSLPKGYDADKVVSTLSSDGVLTVSIPKPAIEDKSNERVVQIQQTGPAHLSVKENAEDKGGAANGSGGDKADATGKK